MPTTIDFPQPPRITGNAASDLPILVEYLWNFYRSAILSGGLIQNTQLSSQLQDQFARLYNLGVLEDGAADKLPYLTDVEDWALADITAFARTLLAVVDADAARTTMGAGDVVGPEISINNNVVVFDGVSGKLVKDGGAPAGDVVGPTGATDGNVVLFDTATGKLIKDGGTLGTAAFTSSAAYDAAGAAAAAQAASQPADADLTTWAGITPGAGIATFLTTPSSANLKATLTDETGSGAAVFATNPTLVTPALGVAQATSINNQSVDIVVVTNTTVAALSGANSHWLCIAFDKNAISAYAIGVAGIQSDGATMGVVQIAQGGDYSTGWTVSGLNIRLTSNVGGSNCRASFLRIR